MSTLNAAWETMLDFRAAHQYPLARLRSRAGTRLIDEQDLGTDGVAAVAAYSAKEKEFQGRELIEIVLVGSDSIETVRLTHASYFDGSVAVSKYLAGI